MIQKKRDFTNSIKKIEGQGLGFRTPYYEEILSSKPRLDFFEIVSENFIEPSRKPCNYLEKLRALYPVAMHGVSLSIGSVDPLNRDYLKKLKALNDFLEPPYVSDHLCWTSYGTHNSHDLLPAPYTRECLNVLIPKVLEAQDFLKRRLYLENPSMYATFAFNEMTEVEFYRELIKATGCGILLDINNVYVNSQNVGLDPLHYLLNIPRDAVSYFHLAGHAKEDGVLVDTHDHPVCGEVWELYKIAVKLWPQTATLVEWDDNYPSFERLLEESKMAESIRQASLAEERPLPERPLESQSKVGFGEEPIALASMQESFLGGVTTPLNLEPSLTTALLHPSAPITPERGAQVYQNAYWTRLVDVLGEIFPALAFILEEEGFWHVASLYLKSYPPSKMLIDFVGERLPDFLYEGRYKMNFGVPAQTLGDLAALEWADYEIFMHPDRSSPLSSAILADLPPEKISSLRVEFTGARKLLKLQWQVGSSVADVKAGKTPPLPLQVPSNYLVLRPEEDVFIHELSADESFIFEKLSEGRSFGDCLAEESDLSRQEALVQTGTQLLIKAFQWKAVSGLKTD